MVPPQAPSTAQPSLASPPPPPPVPLVGAPDSRYVVGSAAFAADGSVLPPSPPPPAAPSPAQAPAGSSSGSMNAADAVAQQAAQNLQTLLSVFGQASTASFVSACALLEPHRTQRRSKTWNLDPDTFGRGMCHANWTSPAPCCQNPMPCGRHSSYLQINTLLLCPSFASAAAHVQQLQVMLAGRRRYCSGS